MLHSLHHHRGLANPNRSHGAIRAIRFVWSLLRLLACKEETNSNDKRGTTTWHHKTTNDQHPVHHQSAITDEYTAEAVTHTASSTWGGYGANLNEKLIETQ